MIPVPPSAADDTASSPWTITAYRSPRGNAREASLRMSSVAFTTPGSDTASARASTILPAFSVEDAEVQWGIRDKTRRLLALLRKKHRELVRAEEEAFNTLLRQADSSVASINAFVAFRQNIEISAQRERERVLPWIKCCFAVRVERIICEEWEERQSIISYEWRLREAKRRVEWLTGTKMRLRRAMELLLHAEECRRRFIEHAELREAWEMPELRPFVRVFKNLGVLGPCPFVSVEDCPFYCRGEGYRSPHFEFTVKGKPWTVTLPSPS
ncbi:hypothetical protein TraAM80_02751 [Trypanosoma rangeli]|uniref:Uncharacterized protein n=1 Tax=Trypanosoma rangeli TaxID=5698 RepID=A0A422NSK1_TRYRA|nr:uncharacterized protein TraAM80_02751 [Trypanosoma rangeli]RNF08448.1 hypothetical protein TraAM80_02751 [Trypanosoma rangeli]|eukprot:RNF08448.1 hypothetical protein TraAM80_02751 [Trypanosoma rangeli]